MTRVSVRLEKGLYSEDQDRPEAGDVTAGVRRLKGGMTASFDRVLIPAGGTDFRELDLEQGTYVIEALLPSSELVSHAVEVGDTPVDVVLRGEYSPREWLSWHHLAGTVVRRREFEAELQAPSPTRSAFVFSSRAGGGRRDRASTEVESAMRSGRPPRLGRIGEHPAPSVLSNHHEGGYSTYVVEADKRFKGVRRYVNVVLGDGGELLGALPDPWVPVDGSTGPARSDVLVAPGAASEPLRPAAPACSIVVRDPVVATMIGYLGVGAVPAAATVLARAGALLYEKVKNPLAAAAGGYVLLASRGEVSSDDEAHWLPWLRNLANWFDWLPDGAIQHGWRTLQEARTADDVVSARTFLLEGCRRGIPFYSAGVRLLLDGLTLLAHEAPGDPQIDRALRSTRALALHTDARSPFTVIRFPATRDEVR